MTDMKNGPQTIVVEEIVPHAPETVWKALTTRDLISRWLMPTTGFEAVVDNRFTYQTTPAGQWDGVIHCEVREVIPNRRLVYAWKGGHADNEGYGAPLDTLVTFTLEKAEGGTRVTLVHSGFVLPRNETAFTGMGKGWRTLVPRLGDFAVGKA
jgi:uncharacterized protein YndB with AHSA1/START domain